MMPDPVLVIAVIADTHVPDRVAALHPDLIPALQNLHPDLILHAGDICAPGVLERLRQVAPVKAVRGNRDWLFAHELPRVLHLELNGVRLTLQHGHGNLFDYLIDKWQYIRDGYRFERYTRVVRRTSGDANVMVFGHTHHAECIWQGNVLMFNPGSASLGPNRKGFPSFGVLKIFENGTVEGDICALDRYQWDGQSWSTSG